MALEYPFEEGRAFEGGMQSSTVDGIGQKQLHPSVAELLRTNKAKAVEASHVKSALRKAGRPEEDELGVTLYIWLGLAQAGPGPVV